MRRPPPSIANNPSWFRFRAQRTGLRSLGRLISSTSSPRAFTVTLIGAAEASAAAGAPNSSTGYYNPATGAHYKIIGHYLVGSTDQIG